MNIHPPTEVHVKALAREQLEEDSSTSIAASSPGSTSPLSSSPNSPLRPKEDTDDEDDGRQPPFVSNLINAMRSEIKRPSEMNVTTRESRKSRIRANHSSWTTFNSEGHIVDSFECDIPNESRIEILAEPCKTYLTDNVVFSSNTISVSPVVQKMRRQQRSLQCSPVSPIDLPPRLPAASADGKLDNMSNIYENVDFSRVVSISDDKSTLNVSPRDSLNNDESGSVSVSTAPPLEMAPPDEQRDRSSKGRSSLFDEDPTISDQHLFNYHSMSNINSSRDETSSYSELLLLPKSISRSESSHIVQMGSDEDPTITEHIFIVPDTRLSPWKSPLHRQQHNPTSSSLEQEHSTDYQHASHVQRQHNQVENSNDPSFVNSSFDAANSSKRSLNGIASPYPQLDPSLDEELKNISMISYQQPEEHDDFFEDNVPLLSASGTDRVIVPICRDINREIYTEELRVQDACDIRTVKSKSLERKRLERVHIDDDRETISAEERKNTSHSYAQRDESSCNARLYNVASEFMLLNLTSETWKSDNSPKTLSGPSSNESSHTRKFLTSSSIEEHLINFLQNEVEFNVSNNKSEGTKDFSVDDPTIAFIENGSEFKENVEMNSYPYTSDTSVPNGSNICLVSAAVVESMVNKSAIGIIPTDLATDTGLLLGHRGNEEDFKIKFTSFMNDSGTQALQNDYPSVDDSNFVHNDTLVNEKAWLQYYKGTIFDSMNFQECKDESESQGGNAGVPPVVGESCNQFDGTDLFQDHNETIPSADDTPLIRDYLGNGQDNTHGPGIRGRRHLHVDYRKKWSATNNSAYQDSSIKNQKLAAQLKRWPKAFYRPRVDYHHKLLLQSPESIGGSFSEPIHNANYSTAAPCFKDADQGSAQKSMMEVFNGIGGKFLSSEPSRTSPRRVNDAPFVQMEEDIGSFRHRRKFTGNRNHTSIVSGKEPEGVLAEDVSVHTNPSVTKILPSMTWSLDEELKRRRTQRVQDPGYNLSVAERIALSRSPFVEKKACEVKSIETADVIPGDRFSDDTNVTEPFNFDEEQKKRCSLFPNVQVRSERRKVTESSSYVKVGGLDVGRDLSLSPNKSFDHDSCPWQSTSAEDTITFESGVLNAEPVVRTQITYAQINVSSGDTVEEVLEIDEPPLLSKTANLGDDIINGCAKRTLLCDESTKAFHEAVSTSAVLLNELNEMVKDLDETLESKEGASPKGTRAQSVEIGLDNPVPAHSNDILQETNRISERNSVASKKAPLLVITIDNDIGIPKGDIMISLLNDCSTTFEMKNSRWSERVDEAVWRCRTLRRSFDTKWLGGKPDSRSKNNGTRSSVIVDVDEIRVLGGVESIGSTQSTVLELLKHDDFEDALVLYESILESYNEYAIDCTMQTLHQHKTYIATALHNIGIIHVLNGNQQNAFTFFERATLIRESVLGSKHPDHIASLAMMSICLYALEDFSAAHSSLEFAASLCRSNCATIAESRLLAEILNNLGCLSYMCGEIESAMAFFGESFGLLSDISQQSIYIGSKHSCHSVSLNLSVCRANIGLVALAINSIKESIAEFESAAQSQLLLLRDAHATLITTLEHLAVANLAAGYKNKALQLLQRMLHMQIDAFGCEDERCKATAKKIYYVEQKACIPNNELIPSQGTLVEGQVTSEATN